MMANYITIKIDAKKLKHQIDITERKQSIQNSFLNFHKLHLTGFHDRKRQKFLMTNFCLTGGRTIGFYFFLNNYTPGSKRHVPMRSNRYPTLVLRTFTFRFHVSLVPMRKCKATLRGRYAPTKINFNPRIINFRIH